VRAKLTFVRLLITFWLKIIRLHEVLINISSVRA
jgi:hypothetical protein